MFHVSVPRNSKISGRVSVVELLLIKVAGEISAFYIFVENSVTYIYMFRKETLILSAGVAGLPFVGFNTVRVELTNKFLRGVVKISENFLEEV